MTVSCVRTDYRPITAALTPKGYRARYNLKADYLMVTETYGEAHLTMVKSIGLGRKLGSKVRRSPPRRQKVAARKCRAAQREIHPGVAAAPPDFLYSIRNAA